MINVRVEKSKRDVLVYLLVRGYGDVAVARRAIVQHLRTEGAAGEAGTIVAVDETARGVDVETDRCGFGIDDVDIQHAIDAGVEVSC